MNWLGKLSVPQNNPSRSRSAGFESLETRRVMAAALSADAGVDSLVANNDTYEVRYVSGKTTARSIDSFFVQDRDQEVIVIANDRSAGQSGHALAPGIEGSDIGSGG